VTDSTGAFSAPLYDDPRHMGRTRRDQLYRHVPTTREIAVKETLSGTAVLSADVSAERFLLHVNLRRHRTGSRHFRNIRRLGALLSLDDLELYLIAFGKRLEAATLNCAVVDEDVRPTLTGNKTKAFCVIEPLHGAGNASH
jgi:hypothetical protein